MAIESRRQACQPQAGQKGRKLENTNRAKVGLRDERRYPLTPRVREVDTGEKRWHSNHPGKPANCRLPKKGRKLENTNRAKVGSRDELKDWVTLHVRGVATDWKR